MGSIRRCIVTAGAALLLAACNEPPVGPTPTSLVVVQAPSGFGAPGWELIDTLTVLALDESGHPRAGVAVSWTVRQGGGSVASLADETDANGLAAAVWTLGGQAGANIVRASEPVGEYVDFHSTGEAFKVDRLVSQWGIGCGLVDGAIWCWGDYFWGRGDPVSHTEEFGWGDYGPERVAGGPSFLDLSVSPEAMVCGLDAQSAVWCATSTSRTLAPVTGLPQMRDIVGAGYSGHCGLAVSDSTPWCWGTDGLATQLAGIPSLSRVWIDDGAACGLRADSTAICWGRGLLGNGSTGDSPTPVVVNGGHRFVELTVAYGHESCGRTATWEMWCWGVDDDGTSPGLLVEPTLIFTGARAFATWYQMVQVLDLDGNVLRWEGADFGPLQTLTGLAGLPITRLAANNNVACLQQVDDQVTCFDEMFENSSAAGWFSFSPVQPLRQAPLTTR